MSKPNSVVHFEMGYEDRERAKKFYSETFGWKMNQMGEEMGNYVVVDTGVSDDPTGKPTKPGYINGGMYQKTDNPNSQAPSFVISVDDINQAMKDAVANGGKVLGGMGPGGEHVDTAQEIPGVGMWISMQDTEGNRFSLLQPKEM